MQRSETHEGPTTGPLDRQEEPRTDKTASQETVEGCFFCGLGSYHPTCDRPGCENQTHGFGPEGKRTLSYCGSCRSGPL